MAYDKVIDSARLDAAMTATANAIREKTGDAALLQWLADKGFADAIAAIEAGGGGSIVAGTYTPASTQTSRVTVTHNLGKEPTGVLFAKYHSGINSGADTVLFQWQSGGVGIRCFVYSGKTITISQTSISGAESQVHTQNQLNTDIVCGLTETTFQTPKNLYAGTYIWVVFGEVLK